MRDHIAADYVGNIEFLEHPKTAFLCSRKVPASIVLKCYDWAIAQRKTGICVISGFHSQIEKDVLHYLLEGDQPVILALERGLKKRLASELTEALAKDRLLIITPFGPRIRHANQATANRRNQLVAELADEIFVPVAQPGGNIDRLVMKWLKKGKIVRTFNVPENEELIAAGAVGRIST